MSIVTKTFGVSSRGRVVDADTGLKPRSIEIGTLRENYREVREVLVEITTDPSDAPADCREEVLP